MQSYFMTTSFNLQKNDRSPVKLKNLSPQKYGKAAYDQNRTYTPYKLAQNIMYRQVTTLKKVQQGNGKVRQFQAINSLLKERLMHAQQQKIGIQKALNDQINMYKKLIKQKQQKNEIRLREIQTKFRQQIRQLIQQKQEQVKYFQSQKQILQNRIEQLQNYINQLNGRLNNQSQAYISQKTQKQKRQIQLKNLHDKYTKMQNEKNIQIHKMQQHITKINQNFKNQKNQLKLQSQRAIMKKQIQMQTLQKKLQSQIQKINHIRQTQNQINQTEIKQLKQELEHLNILIKEQTRQNQQLIDTEMKINAENVRLKQNVILNLTEQIQQIKLQHQKEMKNLEYENIRLQNLLKQMDSQNHNLALQINGSSSLFQKFQSQRLNLLNHIQSLKQQIQLNQINYIRQKDQNVKFSMQMKQKQLLQRQIFELRQLLIQSSKQIQICREKFLLYERQNKKMRYQIDRITVENQSLLRLRRDLQQEAVKWRQNYLRLAH